MKKYIEFILESNKFVTVDYKIMLTDTKDNPELLVTDFKIINHEDKKLKIKAKGYIISYVETDGKKRKCWVEFDDFKDDKTRTVWNKNVENGTKRIKVSKD